MSTTSDAPQPEANDSPAASLAEAKPVRRRRAVKAPEGMTGAAVGDAQTDPIASTTAPDLESSVAPVRAPRRRATAAAVEAGSSNLQVLASTPLQVPEHVAEVVPKEGVESEVRTGGELPLRFEALSGATSAGEPSEAGLEAAADDDRSTDRGRRRNRRERQRANRLRDEASGGVPNSLHLEGGPSQTRSPEQVVELFAQVLSGDFDAEQSPADGAAALDEARTDEAVDAEAAAAPASKRVLAPDPDAPKLQKVLGQAGVGSRRDMEELILDGRITVNGEPAHIGQRISFGDRIEVNGRAIKYRIAQPRPRVLAYHKPVGEVVTRDDPQQRPTVFRGLPPLQHGKWQSVGRLDINTEGLLLFTNSGELANQLMHPRFGVEREYAVRVLGTLDNEARERLLQGVMVEGQNASFRSIEDGGGEGANHWYRVVITEGRHREVRKLFDAVGLTVSRLIRIRYGTVVLPRGLKRGVWVDLEDADVRLIRQLASGARAPKLQPDGASARVGGARGPQGDSGERGPRPHDRAGRADHGPRREPLERPQIADVRAPDSDEDLDFDPSRIPNPLEQTFDRRFAQNTRSPFGRGGGGGFGAGGSAPTPGPKRGNGPREPDPLQTSVGYIGADAFHRKSGRRGPGGGAGGDSGGGGFGGNRGGHRGGGGRGGQRGR